MSCIELKILAGELKGRTMTFTRPDCLLFGRALDATLNVTEDPFVSRHHFLLEIAPPHLLLSDLGSTNGFYVNETRYGGVETKGRSRAGKEPAPRSVFLCDGDQILVGQTRLAVAIWDADPVGKLVRRKSSGRRSNPLAGTPSPSMADLFPEAVIGPYRVNQEIGRGWMGATYQAVDSRSGRVVALKTMVPNVVFTEAAAEAFLKSVGGLQRLDHPAICKILDVWRMGNMFTCVEEFIDGMDLSRFLAARGGVLQMAEAVPIMLDVLAGLAYLHAGPVPGGEDLVEKGGSPQRLRSATGMVQGVPLAREAPTGRVGVPILHRNLKPENILIASQGREIRARLGNGGLFPALEAAGLTQLILSGLYADAPNYWPRERFTFFERSLASSDVFAAAAIFYEILTGFLVRDGLAELREGSRKAGRIPGLSEYLRIIAENPPIPIRERNSEIPPAVAEVIDRALAEPIVERGEQDPEGILADARFADGSSFLAALLEALEVARLNRRESPSGAMEVVDLPGERVEAALLVLDLAGSTQMVDKKGTAYFTGIVNFFNRLFRDHESKVGLRFLKCTGDGYFAVYRQTEDALRVGRTILSEAARQEVSVRIAVNWGLITIAGDGDFLGREVHRLFRIEGLKEVDRVSGPAVAIPAHGRLLAARAFAERHPGEFQDIGLFRLKGFAEPSEVFLLR